ncbi:hypothetical protein [Trichlorobacter sp.]|uniref:hypothetical protein n=1 Tax=Trichlorobacter sp. TaxID=2911007 RepID=UPI002A36D28D|nr:hypothetical protein [Trichlorobacter sp.]MDY0383596.1 hypothetical protein [Trichlorobacter sp.]
MEKFKSKLCEYLEQNPASVQGYENKFVGDFVKFSDKELFICSEYPVDVANYYETNTYVRTPISYKHKFSQEYKCDKIDYIPKKYDDILIINPQCSYKPNVDLIYSNYTNNYIEVKKVSSFAFKKVFFKNCIIAADCGVIIQDIIRMSYICNGKKYLIVYGEKNNVNNIICILDTFFDKHRDKNVITFGKTINLGTSMANKISYNLMRCGCNVFNIGNSEKSPSESDLFERINVWRMGPYGFSGHKVVQIRESCLLIELF